MNQLLFRFFIIGLYFLPLAVKAQIPLKLHGEINAYPLGPHLAILEDKNHEFSQEEILLDMYADQFVPSLEKTPSFGLSSSVYWVRFMIDNTEGIKANWVLSVETPEVDFISIFVPNQKGGYLEKRSGFSVPFKEREVKNRNAVFKIPIEAGTNTYFMRFQSSSVMVMPVSLLTEENFLLIDHNEQLLLGVYYGIIFVMALYNLLIFFNLRDKAYLWYTIYITGYAFLQAVFNGIDYEYFWPDSPFWHDHAMQFFVGIAQIGVTYFTFYFLRITTFIPKWKFWYTGLAMISISYTIIQFFLPRSLGIIIANLIPLYGIVLFILSSVICIKKGYSPAIYYLIAWITLLTGGAIFILRDFGVLPHNFITVYGVQIGSAMEVILLSFGLAHRITLIRKELAMEQLKYQQLEIEEEKRINAIIENKNKELEKKVAERTKALMEQNQVIEKKNQELALQTELLTKKNVEIDKQNLFLEKKNIQITESLMYAKRLQEAMMLQPDLIKKYLPESSILYLPKEIVSGDFYWFSKVDNKIIIAVIDCTGHGIPGAFMSAIGHHLLNDIVNKYKITEPDKILFELHKGIQYSLKQNETLIQDGMDVAICIYDQEKGLIEYAGANTPLIAICNNQLQVFKGNKVSVGGHHIGDFKVFTKHEIVLNGSPSSFYMFSDGYPDQFGGPKNKKFMIRKFKNLLNEIYNLPMGQQKEMLLQNLIQWKGNEEQVDDILVVGFKV
jgi:two-component system, sensor histidine kinase LadS